MWKDSNSTTHAAIAIVESNPRLAEKLVRILSPASRFRPTVCVPSVRNLRDHVGPDLSIVACQAKTALELAPALANELRDVRLMVWTDNADREVFTLAQKLPTLVSIVAWPERQETPRLWELALPIRRVVVGDDVPLHVREFLQWEGPRCEWLPRSTADLVGTLEEVERRLEQLTVPKRLARRIVGVGHELLMNAMYDAPVDDRGQPLYAHDRTKQVTLDPRDAPRFTLATDGMTVALQTVDRFGGLKRKHVHASIERGFRSRDADATREEVVFTGQGGAGLGLHRIVFQANAAVFEVIPHRATVATALFELDQPNKEARICPRSLHIFRRFDPAEHTDAG